MSYIEKYYKRKPYGFREIDSTEHIVLLLFEKVHNGTADFDVVFKMVPEEDMEFYLDDDDYAFWLEQKALHAND